MRYNINCLVRALVFFILLFVYVASAIAQPITATLVGNTSATFETTYGGAASYKIPLNLPAGAAGLQPTLSFYYNSQFANGVMGLGWQLASGLARIEECYQRNSSQRILCLNGDELVSQGNGFYRTEIDSSVLVETINSTEFVLHFENGTQKNQWGQSL